MTIALPLDRSGNDPAVIVACVLLVGVSIGWVVGVRAIVRAQRIAALRGEETLIDVKGLRTPRDLWSAPP